MDAVLRRLKEALESHAQTNETPFVCATWAQTLDGYIAETPGVPTAISCPETFELAHEIRAMLDSILVGVGTLLADNPRLNARLERPVQSPRPIILDSVLRTPCNARVFDVERPNKPVVLCKQQIFQDESKSKEVEKLAKRAALIPIENPEFYEDCGLHLPTVYRELQRLGIHSVMIEGGGRVLNSVLSSPQANFAVISISSRLLGGGVAVFQKSHNLSSSSSLPVLRDPSWHVVGSDVVLCGYPALEAK